MSPQNHNWSEITDINERRKAQNRKAQKNYRTRQKLRTQLVEAVLLDMPRFCTAAALTGRRQKQSWPALGGIEGWSDRLPTTALLDGVAEGSEAVRGALPISPRMAVMGSHDADKNKACQALSTATAATTAAAATTMTTTTTTTTTTSAATPQSHAEGNGMGVDFDVGPDLGLPAGSPATEGGSAISNTTDATADLGRYAVSLSETVTPSSASTALNFEPMNPLLTAISMGDLHIADLLLRSGADIDKRDAHGRTALHLAVERGDVGMARTLLDMGADVMTGDAQGRRLLHTAVENDNAEMVRLVLCWCKGKQAGGTGPRGGEGLTMRCIDARDGRKMTPVHLCVLLKRIEILQILLDHGADVNIGC
ncbi:ankyrin repeat-containing domain protein [Lasiosphaeris hirsuta]|uniref:Ankyrin repeat-containing domain protein n=1 Tax=Lasiosphaeris hirsuta TaxID=260670 RepID=A0AA40B002_9PEZI|nr:ankyrin repeat-containing domain protein [Lasiosphaeris hirsuta]